MIHPDSRLDEVIAQLDALAPESDADDNHDASPPEERNDGPLEDVAPLSAIHSVALEVCPTFQVFRVTTDEDSSASFLIARKGLPRLAP